MSTSSSLDPDIGIGSGAVRPPGHDTGALGPSDLSDTGSDSVGPTGYDRAILGSDSDSAGTGVDPSPGRANDDDPGPDIGFDRIVGAGEAGLGGGLDQAEEARYGVTDEMLDPVDEAGAPLDPDGTGPSSAARRRAARDADVERGDAAGDELPDEDGEDLSDVELPDEAGDDEGDEGDDPDAR